MRRKNAKNSNESADPDKDGGETFLGRWSRRKQRARREPEVRPSAEPQAPSPEPAAGENKTAERILTDEDMPPLESLDADSDYSGFLSPGVSEALRNAALKKMFLSPKYNIVDGLDDYADDFTKFEPLGDIITADMRHQMELAEERAKKALEEELAASTDERGESVNEDANAGAGDEREARSESAEQKTLSSEDELARTDSDNPSNDEPRSG